MDILEVKKKEFQEMENSQITLISRYLEQQRKRFEYSDSYHWVLQDKNESDLIFISEKLSEFQSKVKKDGDNYKLFNELILALLRIQSYCVNMETVAKESVAKMVSEFKTNERLNSEIRKNNLINSNEINKLKKELENAKKEIEFQTNSK